MDFSVFDIQKADKPENVRASIEVMKRVMKRGSNFYIGSWRRGTPATDEDAAHNCGTVCCLGGWVALSKEFQDAGGAIDMNGVPVFNGEVAQRAMAEYWGVDVRTAEFMTFTDLAFNYRGDERLPDFYPGDAKSVTPDMVIERLELML